MIVNPDIEQYLSDIAPAAPAILKEMAELGASRQFPIIGPLVGQLLGMLVRISGARQILECGSGFGYSAMWMAHALPEDGRITCIEYDAGNIRTARQFFSAAGMAQKVSFLEGDVQDHLEQLAGPYDMVVNDVDKEQYPLLLPLLTARLRRGGILVTDNVLWKGRVAAAAADDTTAAVQAFNTAMMGSSDLWSTIVPLRDGVAIAIRR